MLGLSNNLTTTRVGGLGAIPGATGSASFLDGAGNTVTAPILGQPLFIAPGTFSGTPTVYDYQVYAAGVAIGDATGTWDVADPAPSFVPDDALVGLALSVKCHGRNSSGTSPTTNDSAATTALADISLTNAITAFTRTSATTVTPMTWSVTFAANVYEGYYLHARVYSDSALITLTQDVVHYLTNADLQSGATIDLASDGLTAIGANDWLQLTVETTSPNGVYYSYTYGTALTPTDAVVVMTWSASDKNVNVSLANSNLTAFGTATGAVRTNRGISSGKSYVEFVSGPYMQACLYDGAASLTTNYEAVANGGSPAANAAVYYGNNATVNYNTTNFAAASFNGAMFTASISGTTLTVTVVNLGTLAVGQYLAGPSIPWGTTITGLITGAGGTGTYTLSASITLSSTANLLSGPVVGMAIDKTNNKLWFALNNSWQGASSNPSAGTGSLSISGIGSPVYPATRLGGGCGAALNPGTTPGGTAGFIFTPPTGFVAP